MSAADRRVLRWMLLPALAVGAALALWLGRTDLGPAPASESVPLLRVEVRHSGYLRADGRWDERIEQERPVPLVGD